MAFKITRDALQELESEMSDARRRFNNAEDRYADANISLSPFKVGERVIYRGSEYQIDRVTSAENCTTNCLAFPIKKFGDVGVTRPVIIYSDVSEFTLKPKAS